MLTARATDSAGGVATSAARTITVNGPNLPPVVTLTSPAPGQGFVAPASVVVSATASDANGIARVEFFRDGVLVATITAPPYATTLAGLAAGTYSVAAAAVDSLGARPTTASVSLTVAPPGPQIYYIHSDHLNTPRLITDAQRNPVWSNPPLGEAFGNAVPDEDPRGTGTRFVFNPRFPGQYFDAETGMHYNYYRDGYDPATGRYLQSDPIGLAGGINTYLYVDGNPLTYTDRDGLAPGPAVGWITGNRGEGVAEGILALLNSYNQTLDDWKIPPFVGAGTVALSRSLSRCLANAGKAAHGAGKATYIVTPRGVAIPTNPAELTSNLDLLKEASTNPLSSRKFIGEDSLGPLRVRVEKAHPSDPGFTGRLDPMHTVDHLHIDRRANGTTGAWGSQEKTSYGWPF